MKAQTRMLATLIGVFVLTIFGIYAVQILSSTARNEYSVSSCRVIDKSGYYYLTKDLSGTPLMEREYTDNPFPHIPEPKSCIVITASDVTLDCKGHKITIPKGKGHRGISVGKFGKNLHNVVIKNCKITNGGSATHGYGGMLIVNSAGRGRSQVTCKSTTCNGGKCCYEVTGYDANGNIKEHKVVCGCSHA